jgi:hypothetical protein
MRWPVVFWTLVVIVVLVGCAHRRVDVFYVESASLSSLNAHESYRKALLAGNAVQIPKTFAVTGHRISSGTGTVLAYRAYAPGPIFRTDQGSFQKLTIYVPFSVSAPVSRLGLSREGGTVVFWSSGSSNFPGISGCVGYASAGSLRFDSIESDKIIAALGIEFKSFSPGGWEQDCKQFTFDKTLTFKRKDVHNLTPWEGAEGKHIYDESIR